MTRTIRLLRVFAVIAIFSSAFLGVSYIVHSESALTVSPSLAQTPYTWHEKGVRKKAWLALDETDVVLQKTAVARQDARNSIRGFSPGASIISEHERLLRVKLPVSRNREELEQKLSTLRRSPGIRTAHPVFYSNPSGRKESRMTLTTQIIVQFPTGTSLEMIRALESRYLLRRLKTFSFSHNTYLYETGDAVAGLNLANSLALSRQAVYAYPNWIRTFSKRSIPDDPLFANQWHLNNTGQNGGTPGEDIDITSVWDNYKGSGSVIALVDDGLEIDHEDLRDNVIEDLCWDYILGRQDTTAGEHGTSCAGVAAAKGFNNLGVCGAAPLASLAGHRILSDTGGAQDQDIALALTDNNSDIDIYSNSWGPTDGGFFLVGPSPVISDAIASSVISGRNGRGNIYLWAGGNGGDVDNSNYDGFANSRYVVAVAASTNQGVRSNYSEKGANILVNAPSSGGTLGITTTDRSGSLGYNSDNYTCSVGQCSFGGTSSATPLVAGIIGLILEANPNLGWRDVRNILALTAEKNDPSDSDWTINGAGYHINHKYGFGRVDARSAVDAALTWTTAGPELHIEKTSSPNKPIPENSTGISDTITIEKNLSVEYVEVTFSAADHPYWPDLEVTLISPDGTQSILAERHSPGSIYGSYDSWRFGSARHLGENAKGNWTLRVRDLTSGDTGTFQSWTLSIYGTHAKTPSISGIAVSSITNTTATITWTTDEESTSIVRYGTASSSWQDYPEQAHDDTPVKNHSLTLTGLTDGTPYYFRVGSTDEWGLGPDNKPDETNPSEELSFTTLNNAPPISGIIVSSVSTDSATIVWTTMDPSTSIVRYGPISSSWDSYPSIRSDVSLVTNHSITISGLSEGTTYFFRVGSTDAAGNGPDNPSATNPSSEHLFTTKVIYPYVTGTPHIDFSSNTIDITFSRTGMSGATTQSNYSFSPALSFSTTGIVQVSPTTFRLHFTSIPHYRIYRLTLMSITDSRGYPLSKKNFTLNDDNHNNMADDWEAVYSISDPNGDADHDGITNLQEFLNGTDPTNPASPLPKVPEVVEVHPHDGAGISDSSRIPVNASFAVKLHDAEGINLSNPESIRITIDDGVNPAYTVTLADTDVVRVVRLFSDDDTAAKTLWVIYDRSRETLPGLYPFDARVMFSVAAVNRRGNAMKERSYGFGIETRQEHDMAVSTSPAASAIKAGDPVLTDIYDMGFRIDKGDLSGATVVFSSIEPVKPEFGPSEEIPLFNAEGMNTIGKALNLQPPTVFNTPVRVFIPCPGYSDLSKVYIYLFDGVSWMLGCDGQGNVQDAALGWMVEGSRVDHPDYSPPAVEIRLCHFSAVQAGSSSQPDTDVPETSGSSKGGGCFIATASL